MPIDASPSGTLDVENATLRSRNIVALTNMVAGNDVVRSSAAPTLEVYGDPSHGGNEARLELVSNTANTISTSFTRLTSNAGVLDIQSGTDASDNGTITFGGFSNERMRIAADGNVGIGTTNPLRTLEVQGNGQTVNGGVIHARISDPGSSPYESNTFSMNMGAYKHSVRMDLNTLSLNAFGDAGRYGRMKFVVGDNAASGSGQVDAMTIQAGGYVGIGTVSPVYVLHTNGSLNFNSPWQSSSSLSVANSTSGSYTSPAIPTNTVTNYTGYKVQIRFDPSPGNPPYAACAYVDWFPIGTNSTGPQYNEHQLLTTAHAPNGLDHTMYVSGTMGLGVNVSGLRVRTVSNYYAGTFTTRWYAVGTNV